MSSQNPCNNEYFDLPLEAVFEHISNAGEYYADLNLPDLDETPFQYWKLDHKSRSNPDVLYSFLVHEIELNCWNSSWCWAMHDFERDFTCSDFKVYFRYVKNFIKAIPESLVKEFNLDTNIDTSHVSNKGDKANFFHDVFKQIKEKMKLKLKCCSQ